MRPIVSFIRRDVRHALANAIGIVVIVGIVAVPSFYAWFNIAGSWDPYGDTKNLRVAVVNEDAGYTGELIPVTLDLGERVVTNLMKSDSIGYTPATREDALEGVRSGEYYAAVVIPEDFSACLLSGFSEDPRQAQVAFYQNQKANAIAEIVTDKASAAIQHDIDEGFARTATDVGAGALDELCRLLDDDRIASVAARLDLALTTATDTLDDTAQTARSFSDVLASSQNVITASSNSLDAACAPMQDLTDACTQSADGLRGLGDALDDAVEATGSAFAQGSAGMDDVDAAIDRAFDTADGQAGKLSSALGEAKDAVDRQLDFLRQLSDALAGSDTLVKSFEEHGATPEQTARIHEVSLTIEGIGDRVDQAIAELEDLSQALGKTADDIARTTADAGDARDELHAMVADARESLAGAKTTYDASLHDTLDELADSIDEAVSGVDTTMQGLADTMASVSDGAGTATEGLGSARLSLDDAAQTLDGTADGLRDLRQQLEDALAANDLDRIRTILTSSPDAIASFIATPIEMERHAVFPVDNNGSAMTPFYTTLAIWIGGVVIAALVKATPSERALTRTGCSRTQAYIGRLALFCALGAAQTLLICGGDLWYLGVQCAHPGLFVLAGLLSSFVFVNIIFALTASFGDVGKAVAVVLMVVQVAGAGGTFPQQMLPPFFQAIYPWLPFVHAEGALRAAMFGLYGGDFLIELGMLVLYLIPAWLLGLVLRRPVIRANERLEHALESTRIM
ncbi:YhgE/Pip domain-containing protein [Collinsella tanakaei]|uniref:YhgE/Pip domain-containing protein n=1 Tax=Collinsella tanakaei TaxID=626935 RepID=UPI001F4892D4|nr:YhgE/Pip domain-containing protein [Collinsella tanakaei]MCF2622035.1 YhgE/Pip domain-containing protein [Collinsella tanakaei]